MNNEAMFEKQLRELLRELGPLPEPSCEKIINLARQTQESRQQLKDSLGRLQDSLDYLRVSVKYLLFDLEATRRENAYLKSLLQKME
jgi:uncharacterized protein YfbU (UPF0304 family)